MTLVEHHPLLRLLVVADPEVELAAHDHAELFVVDVMVQEAAGGAAGDAPEAHLQVVAGDDAPPETRPVGLEEFVVLEEVAVGVLKVWHVGASGSSVEH